MRHYAEFARRITALEAVLHDLTVQWTDRLGEHVGTWETFRDAVFSPMVGRMESLSPEECPLVTFDMSQMNDLTTAQQMGLSVLLESIGFPALELVTLPDGQEVWQRKNEIVNLEVSHEQKA